jgi:hypothetical protein
MHKETDDTEASALRIKAYPQRIQTLILSLLIVITLLAVAIWASIVLSPPENHIGLRGSLLLGIGMTVLVLVIAIYRFGATVAENARTLELESIEQRFKGAPDRTQYVSEKARIKLESYLDRNLTQISWMYGTTLGVMALGFSIVVAGLYMASGEKPNFPVSVVASASGVLISFIGGSFLVLSRSVVSQSKNYVAILERINAIGMAKAVIDSIPIEQQDIKNQAKAHLAQQLLALYGTAPPPHAEDAASDKP